jgi:Tfp pilus assembly protein PilF
MRSVWLSLSLAGCLCSMASFTPQTASAQSSDDQQAHAHFQVAASYYEQANYESALREFLEAYRLSQRSQLFYNLSLCYQQLGDLENAVSYLDRYLAEVTDIENRASLETRLANLRERLERQRAGQPTETTEPTETPTETTETPTETTTEPVETTPPPPASGGDSLNVGAIAAFSVAGVGLILGATFTGLAAAEDGRVAALPCAASRSCSASDVSGMQTDALIADIMWGVSLAGAAVGLVLVIVNPGGGGGEHARLRVSPSLAGLTLDGSF